MALVKVVRDNLLSGANLHKLEVGAQVSVSGDVAKRWWPLVWLKSLVMTTRRWK